MLLVGILSYHGLIMLLSVFRANFHFNLIIVSSDSQHPTLVITLWEYPTDHLIQV